MNYFKITLGIFIALAASRFIPHPPNFTSLIALSFYVPAFLGLRYIPALIIGFVITDYFIGFHQFAYFTWGAVICIGLVSEFLKDNYIKRISGTMLGAVLFFLITNLGVWASGMYGLNITGLIQCFYLAIPFFGYTVLSTIIFSTIIEAVFYIKNFIFLKKTYN